MNVESAGDVRARSPKGAMGLMQIMPETWAELRSRYGLGNDPYDPHDNILAGTAYLRELRDRRLAWFSRGLQCGTGSLRRASRAAVHCRPRPGLLASLLACRWR